MFHNTRFQYLALLFVFALFPFEASYALPKWVVSDTPSDYQSPRYLTGVGEGQSLSDAETDALSKIAQQIEVQISSELSNTQVVSNRDGQESISNIGKKEARLATNIEGLTHIEFVKRHQQQDRFYVLAVFDKHSYTQLTYDKIVADYAIYQQRYQQYKSRKMKRFQQDLAALIEMKSLVDSVEIKTGWIHRIQPRFEIVQKPKPSFERLVKQFKTDLAFAKEDSLNTLDIGFAKQPSAIRSQAFYRNQPIKNYPIAIYWQHNGVVQVGSSTTNEKGEFKLSIKHKKLHWQAGDEHLFLVGFEPELELLEERYLIRKAAVQQNAFNIEALQLFSDYNNISLASIATQAGISVSNQSSVQMVGDINAYVLNPDARIKKGRLEGEIVIFRDGRQEKVIDVAKLRLSFSGLNDAQLQNNLKRSLKKLFIRTKNLLNH